MFPAWPYTWRIVLLVENQASCTICFRILTVVSLPLMCWLCFFTWNDHRNILKFSQSGPSNCTGMLPPMNNVGSKTLLNPACSHWLSNKSFIFSHVTVINKLFDIHLDKDDSENKMTSKCRSSIKLLSRPSYLSNSYQHKYIDGTAIGTRDLSPYIRVAK